MLVSKLLRIDDTTIQEIEELVRKLSEKEYTSFSALVRTLIRKGLDTMSKSTKARDKAIKYFMAATHGQPNDIERWVDYMIEASRNKHTTTECKMQPPLGNYCESDCPKELLPPGMYELRCGYTIGHDGDHKNSNISWHAHGGTACSETHATGWENSGLKVSISSIGLANAQQFPSRAGAFVLPLYKLVRAELQNDVNSATSVNAGVLVFETKEELLTLAKALLDLGTK